MRITKLTGANIKGQTFEHDLAPIALFCGDNFAGKSARVESLVLALAGYLPGVEKTPAKVFERLASGNPMSVHIEGGGELLPGVTRTWHQRNGSVKYTGPLVEFSVPPVAVDATEFLGLSGPERVKFLFRVSPPRKEWTYEALADTICANLKNVKVDENTEHTEGVVKSTLAMVRDSATACQTKGNTVVEWVGALIELVKVGKLLADQNAKRMRQTVQGLVQVKADEAAVPTAEADLSRARAQLQTATEAHAKASANSQRAVADVGEAAKASEAVEGEAETRRQLVSSEAAVAALNHSKAKMKDPGPQVPVADALRKANADYNTARVAFGKADADVNRIAKQIDETRAEKVCPTCGQSVEHLKKQLLGSLKAQADNAENVLAIATAKQKQAKTKLDAAQKASDEWSRLSAQATEWSGDMRQAQDDVAVLQSKLATTAGLRDLDANLPELKSKASLALSATADAADRLIAAKAVVAANDTRYKQLVAQRAEAASQAKAVEQAGKAEAEALVLKEALKMLGELQSKMVQQTVGGLLDKCNALCGGILKAPLAYRDGEVGMDGSTGFVSHRTFSGTEKALAYCAISVALAADAPVKVVILDEVGRLDAKNKVKLFVSLCNLQEARVIDQAVLVDTAVPSGELPENMGVIRL